MFEASLTANETSTVFPRERLDFFRKGRIAMHMGGAYPCFVSQSLIKRGRPAA